MLVLQILKKVKKFFIQNKKTRNKHKKKGNFFLKSSFKIKCLKFSKNTKNKKKE